MILEAYGFIVLFSFLFTIPSFVFPLLQWLLANTGSVYTEDTYSWLAFPATIYPNGMFSLKVK
ncbi:hypothetical protein Goshw_021432 [Gossypium schwendimanii]|uniref:Uncharacterized protein n=1 Tax=Gossypium schwendimanii TaxID=34291 RepID=A0A7J9L4W1_GOSSC|nr:hypothetical protein [Gossypium schwendimanii]